MGWWSIGALCSFPAIFTISAFVMAREIRNHPPEQVVYSDYGARYKRTPEMFRKECAWGVPVFSILASGLWPITLMLCTMLLVGYGMRNATLKLFDVIVPKEITNDQDSA